MVEDKAKGIIRIGADLAGAMVGSALGFLAGGPAAAGMAGAGGVIIAEGANALLGDIATRQLSKREQVRVGAAAAFALSSIRRRLESGESPRTDLFGPGASQSSNAAQLLEGVLLKAKNEHEEKKVHLLGEFFSNLAFSPEVSVGEANHMLRIVETLTYRQLCFVALLQRLDIVPSIPLAEDELNDPGLSSHPELASLLQEVYGVADLGLMARRSDELRGGYIFERERYVTPVSMSLSPFGTRLASLLDLQSLPLEEIEPIASLLHLPAA